MAATKQDISRWFDRALRNNQKYMLVVCDQFDYEDYPLYANDPIEAKEKYAEFNGNNMQKVMEVYDMSVDRNSQLDAHRAFNLPE